MLTYDEYAPLFCPLPPCQEPKSGKCQHALVRRDRTRWSFTLLLLGLLLFGGRGAAADPAQEAESLRLRADHYFQAGSFQEAAQAYRSATQLLMGAGNEYGASFSRHQAAFAHWGFQDLSGALALFNENLNYHRRRGDGASIAFYLLYSSQVLVGLNRAAEALPLLAEAQTLFGEQWEHLATVAHWQVAALEQLQDPDGARKVLRKARERLPAEGWSPLLAGDERLLFGPEGMTATAGLHPWTVAGWAVALLAVGAVGVLGIGVRQGRNWLATPALLLLAILCGLGMAEGMLALGGWPGVVRYHQLHPANRVTRFHPLPGVLPGVTDTESRFTTNALGLRGDPLPGRGALRLLAIGGSSTECLYLDDRDAWPYRLQEALRRRLGRPVWVGNAGKSGLNTFGHWVQVHDQGQELQPDWMIVTAGINDLNQCLSGGLQAIRDNAVLAERADFLDQYRQYVFESIPRLAMVPAGPRLFRWWNQVMAKSASAPFAVVQDVSGFFHEEQRRRRKVAEKVRELPEMEVCLAAFRANLTRMARLARERKQGLVLVTQGSLYRSDLSPREEQLLWFGAVGENFFAPVPPARYYDTKVLSEGLARYNQVTLEVCRQEGGICFDTDQHLPKSTETYYDDVHFNPQGSRALAEKLAEFLEGRVSGERR